MTQRLRASRSPAPSASLNMRRSAQVTRHLLVWHRRLGLAASVIVLLLAVTGLLLNHADRLRLNEIELRPDWLLTWYGFSPIDTLVSHRTGDRWFSWSGARLYLDERTVMDASSAPVGAVQVADDVFAVGFADMLVLVNATGEIVERMGAGSIPGKIERIGNLGADRLVVGTKDGQFSADTDVTQWRPTDASPQWSAPGAMPQGLRDRLLRAERGPGLPAERVLLDLHSGRIFGQWGPWVMDGAAIAFVVLAITGVGNWWRRQARATRSS